MFALVVLWLAAEGDLLMERIASGGIGAVPAECESYERVLKPPMPENPWGLWADGPDSRC